MTGNADKSAKSGSGSEDNAHWSDLKALFDSAISLPPGDRPHFLERECGHDSGLREELESLLLAYDNTGDFLEQPLASLSPLVEEFESARTTTQRPPAGDSVVPAQGGDRIGPYRLERELGRGGMGAVFLATRADGEFHQRVAIKLIRRGWDSDFGIRRFRHERQILASFDHPHIARLLDGGTTEAGMPYFVMEYVEGRPVTSFCEEFGLNTQARLQLFLRICSAVQYAHERSVIHRDLKPGNILVRADATPKLLDFGIAKLIAPDPLVTVADATAAGFRLLTPAYASPEQMRGDAATVRSDVYSLGIILYELLWGERPSLSDLGRGLRSSGREQPSHISHQLQSIVFQAIHWDPDDRYSSVDEFAQDLERYGKGAPLRANDLPGTDKQTTSSLVSIAILPLRFAADRQENEAFLASGIAEALVTRLSRVERLSVRPTSATLRYAGQPDTARAARELKVKYILEGSIGRSESFVRVNLQLVFAEASAIVWAAQFDRPAEDLIELEHSIAEEVASALLPRLSGEERALIGRVGTDNSKAHEAYLRGRWHWHRSAGDQEELKKALVCFSQAIAEDENYALAHAGLADYYIRLGLWGGLPPSESFAAAMDSALRALRLDPSSGEVHASVGFAYWAYRRDYRSAEQHFHLAIVRNPDYASAHHWFGLLNSARNQPELAIANLERAHNVEPASPVIVAALGFVHYNARDFEKAAQLLGEAAKELRNSAVVQEMLAWCWLKMNDTRRARDCAQLAVAVSGRSPSALSVLAHALAASGDRADASALCGEIDELHATRYVSGYDRASAYLAAGSEERALAALEAAVDECDWWITWLGVEPRWDQLRRNARFQKLVETVQPKTEGEWTTQTFHPAPTRRALAWTASVVLLVAIAIAALFWMRVVGSNRNFQNFRITKITANGIANAAAISPDGKLVAYTTSSSGKSALWLRDVATGKTRSLTPSTQGNIAALDFTNGGKSIGYVHYWSEQSSDRTLFLLNINGGAPRKVVGPFGGGGAITTDGSRAVTIERSGRVDEIWIHDLKANSKRRIKTYLYPERVAWVCMPAWSPDGKRIAFAAEQRDAQGFLLRLVVIDAATGQTKQIRSPRWNWVQHIAWTGDNAALAVVAQERDSPFRQIWSIPVNGGNVRRVGNDLDNYLSASITADSTQLVSVQVRTESNIYVAGARNLTRPTQITPGSGRYFDLSWTPDGSVLYASDATGSADLWIMNADGSGQRQLYSGSGRNYAPLASPDGKNIAFHSNRTGNWQIWRVDSEGQNATQLSRSSRDGNWPQFSRDGRDVIYHQTDLNGSYNLWRVPVGGGEPSRLTADLTMHPAVSMKDGRIASWWSRTVASPQWKIATFAPGGGNPEQIFNPTPAAYPDTTLRWTPSGTGLTYLDHDGGVANIWRQPLDGSPPRKLTNFTSGEIYSLDWSADNRLLYSRGLTTSDVVLIRNEKQ